jgi:hypothetical protein
MSGVAMRADGKGGYDVQGGRTLKRGRSRSDITCEIVAAPPFLGDRGNLILKHAAMDSWKGLNFKIWLMDSAQAKTRIVGG